MRTYYDVLRRLAISPSILTALYRTIHNRQDSSVHDVISIFQDPKPSPNALCHLSTTLLQYIATPIPRSLRSLTKNHPALAWHPTPSPQSAYSAPSLGPQCSATAAPAPSRSSEPRDLPSSGRVRDHSRLLLLLLLLLQENPKTERALGRGLDAPAPTGTVGARRVAFGARSWRGARGR
jgi:hypothetical protein